jgi:hypothetical protein
MFQLITEQCNREAKIGYAWRLMLHMALVDVVESTQSRSTGVAPWRLSSSMQKSSSWKYNGHLASQEMLKIYGPQKVVTALTGFSSFEPHTSPPFMDHKRSLLRLPDFPLLSHIHLLHLWTTKGCYCAYRIFLSWATYISIYGPQKVVTALTGFSSLEPHTSPPHSPILFLYDNILVLFSKWSFPFRSF